MFKNLFALPLVLCLVSLPTLLKANPIDHTSLSRNYAKAEKTALALSKASTAAEGLAAVGKISQANKMLETNLNLVNKIQNQVSFNDQPLSLEFLALARPILKTTFQIDSAIVANLGTSAIEKMKYQHYVRVVQKAKFLFETIDTQTYLPLMDECKEDQCAPQDLIIDQFFSAQKAMLLSLISLANESHQTFYDSRIELQFLTSLFAQIIHYLAHSPFRKGWICLDPPLQSIGEKMDHFARGKLSLSANERAERVIKLFQSTKQLILTIQSRDTCSDLEK